jgi:shikimate kinase
MLVYIYGPPASGKLTVAERLAELTGLPLFHNHLTVNAVRPVFEFGSPPFRRAVLQMRMAVFEAAAESGTSLIYTNNSAWEGAGGRARFEEFADTTRRMMESHGSTTFFVRLTAPASTLEERLANESRQSHQKLTDVERLREMLAVFDPAPLHPQDLTIDTSVTGPDEAARIVAAQLVTEA